MISRDEVLNLAELARLKLSESEVESLQKDISNILEYVGQVSAVSIRNGGETKPVQRNVMRADEPAAVLGERAALVEAFPQKEKAPQGGVFNVVRKIIQKDE